MRLSWLLLAGVPTLLSAQGFGVYEHSTCVMGRAGVSAAAPCPDGSAVFFNPAGLAGLTGGRVSLGVTGIQANGAWVDDRTNTEVNLDNPLIPVPNLYATYAFNPKLTVGVGVYAPYGLETHWPVQGFEGRFLGYNTQLRSIYVQPTVAYQVHDKVKLGVGVAYITSDLELHQRVDLSQQAVPAALGPLPPGTTFGALGIPFGTDFADATLEGSGSGYAVNFGGIIKINEQISIGGHWLTHETIDYEGDAAFTPVATNLVLPITIGPLPAGTPVDQVVVSQFAPGSNLSNGPVVTQITMPSQGSLGVAWRSSPKWMFMADYHYVVWGYFSTLPVDFQRFPNDDAADFELYEGYSDTHGIRLGAEFFQSEKTTIRFGYLFHTEAAPDETVTPLLPEAARHELAAGYGTRFGSSTHLNLAYQYIRQNRRRGRVYPAQYGNTGIYEFSASLLSASLTFTF